MFGPKRWHRGVRPCEKARASLRPARKSVIFVTSESGAPSSSAASSSAYGVDECAKGANCKCSRGENNAHAIWCKTRESARLTKPAAQGAETGRVLILGRACADRSGGRLWGVASFKTRLKFCMRDGSREGGGALVSEEKEKRASANLRAYSASFTWRTPDRDVTYTACF